MEIIPCNAFVCRVNMDLSLMVACQFNNKWNTYTIKMRYVDAHAFQKLTNIDQRNMRGFANDLLLHRSICLKDAMFLNPTLIEADVLIDTIMLNLFLQEELCVRLSYNVKQGMHKPSIETTSEPTLKPSPKHSPVPSPKHSPEPSPKPLPAPERQSWWLSIVSHFCH